MILFLFYLYVLTIAENDLVVYTILINISHKRKYNNCKDVLDVFFSLIFYLFFFLHCLVTY